MKNIKICGGYWLVELALLASLLLLPDSLRAQGSLTPPGAPAPTMKTLAQIEPRTPVDAVNTPGNSLAQNTAAQFAITQPGSYYLTGNLAAVAGVPFGIAIETNDVTLDLNGFAMTGLGAGYYGIVVSGLSRCQNLVIRNGTLRNWGGGVAATNGDCELEHLRVFGGAARGFDLGNGCVVADCLVSSNETGISAGSDCTISGTQANDNLVYGINLADNFNVNQCTANGNGSCGFNLGNYGQVSHCTANANGNDAIEDFTYGIVVQTGCAVNDCTTCGNLGLSSITGGILALGNDSTVNNCTASGNIDGIDLGVPITGDGVTNCTVKNCTATGNLGSGIFIQGGLNRVDNNNVGSVNNNYGIYPNNQNVGNRITRNSSFGGYWNYGGNNDYAPIQTPNTATSPWANF